MNCLEFRRQVGAEPHSQAPEIAQHAAQCVPCARFRQQMQQMDSLIHRAFAIDVQAPAAQPAAAPRRRMLQWGLAASVMLAVAVTILWLGFPRDTLAEEVIAHVMDEPESLRSGAPIDQAELADVLAASQLLLRPGMNDVSYASSCPFRGNRVPHFVVQTARGPVTVMLLTKEAPVPGTRQFKEEGFEGVIMPAPRGLLVVLGKDALLEEIATKVFAAVDYQMGW
ncbi:DUF3379 family protein [Povalibacter sp.]|uniref:DUF3379 family protein n=1 Tax=Povalibacter sp. TaxID=1962978 RepID=UPI002F40F655